MTSSGLKRPLDLELTNQAANQTSGSGATAPSNTTCTQTDKNPIIESLGLTSSPHGDDIANGTKRRCTDTKFKLSPTTDDINTTNTFDSPSPQLNQQQQLQVQMITSPSPPINDSLDRLSTFNDDLASQIKNELQRIQQQPQVLQVDPINKHSDDEQLILTERQLRSICEKLILDREKKLRDEYDRRLARKLAEQYDLFAKANYLNTFAEPTLNPSSPILPATTLPSAAATVPAANFMQRTSVDPTGCSPNTLAGGTSMTNLTTIASSLATDGTIPSQHHHLTPYSLQQRRAAATATAIRLAQQHQQQQQQQRISIPMNGLIPSGPVLLTSNLDDQLATPEALFTLFGVFGDVIRVKILFNKKDNALIQMADASRAQVAQSYLDKQRIFGKVIRVTRSKHQIVQMPRDGNQSDAGLTKDFTNSPLHRFKIPGSRNYLNIYPPSNTLHVSNIPSAVDEAGLRKAFESHCGFEIISFKFFPKDRKMALMRFETVEHATIALIKMHNFQISEENNLRVSFSKSAL